MYDERQSKWLLSLDKGVTKFYDVQQLIQFYQLNAGHLPTKLTHVVQSDLGIPGISQISENRASSCASTPDASPESKRLDATKKLEAQTNDANF